MANHLDVAKIYHIQDELHQAQGKYEHAEPLFLRALRIKESQN